MRKKHEADLRPFDLAAASQQEYDPTHFQPVLFCADSFEMMAETLREYLVNW
jgi:phenylalanine-4-hydroxylase